MNKNIVALGLPLLLVVAACGGKSLFTGKSGTDSSGASRGGAGLYDTWIVQQTDPAAEFERYEISSDTIEHVLVCDQTIHGQELLAMAKSSITIAADQIEVLEDDVGETNYKHASCEQSISKGTLNFVLNGDVLTFTVPAGTITMHRKR